jgi:hypothetical protein
MEMLLPDGSETIALGLFAAAILVVWLARRFPDVTWLQPFQLRTFQLTEAQKARHRRAGNRQAALEIMLMGLMLPVLYLLSSLFMFNDPKATPMAIALAGMVVCFGVGIWLFARNR